MNDNRPGPAPTVLHSERLAPPPTWHLLSVLGGISAGLTLSPLLGMTAAGVVGVLVGVGFSVLLVTTAPLVRVADGELRAGPAHVPLDLLGRVEALDEAATRAALGPELDARSYVCLRSWARTAVRVSLEDPADPTPSWIVSTRRPLEVAEAIAAGRSAVARPAPGTE